VIFYDRLTWKYVLQLKYWKGPIAAYDPFSKILGGGPQGSTPLIPTMILTWLHLQQCLIRILLHLYKTL